MEKYSDPSRIRNIAGSCTVPEELRLGDAGIPDEEDVDVAPEPGPVVQVLLHAAQQHAQQGLTSN